MTYKQGYTRSAVMMFWALWAVLFFSGGRAAAETINLNSKALVPTTLFLTAGTYQISPRGPEDGNQYLFTAWNAWGWVSGCDAEGKNCERGWLNRWNYFSEEFSRALSSPDKGVYRTDDRALEYAEGLRFTLSFDQTVYFYIDDPDYLDNQGGISLEINPVQE